jgi:fused signal recognition particle receptor
LMCVMTEGASMAWLGEKIRAGLAKTRNGLLSKLETVIPSGRKVDEELLAELEDVLLGADVGLPATEDLLERVRERSGSLTADGLREILKSELMGMLAVESSVSAPAAASAEQVGREEASPTSEDRPRAPAGGGKPEVVLVVGVNGAGKTTTIGKLAYRLSKEGKKVMVAASDTYRAAAVEQLEQWTARSGGDIVRQGRGADPAAVAYDALEAARARGCDCLLVDTAGRLHTKANLMEELKKIRRVLGRQVPGAPHRVLLVLDATAGQNALIQAREFGEATGVTGIVVAKLDGTARGGAVIAIARELKVPVEMLGVGEGPEDLVDFDAAAFVDALVAS